jgi:hypothetical protein
MTERKSWASGWRGGVLVVLGVVLGATILQPAVADVSNSVRHLTRQHLDPRYVNTGEAAGGDLSGRHGNLQIRPDAVTGAEVDEDSLGSVPTAANADHATTAGNATNAFYAVHSEQVDGNSVATFNLNTTSAALTQMFNLGGLTVKASCLSDHLNVYAGTDTDNSFFRTSVGTSDPDFDTADGDMLVFSANTSDQNGTMAYRRGATSGVVVVTFGYETNPSTGNDCQLQGVAMGSEA